MLCGDLNWKEIQKGEGILKHIGFPGGSDSRESACNAGDLGLIPGSRRSPGKGILAWQIPWMEEPGELQPVRHD